MTDEIILSVGWAAGDSVKLINVDIFNGVLLRDKICIWKRLPIIKYLIVNEECIKSRK